jgi:hypothetical protein
VRPGRAALARLSPEPVAALAHVEEVASDAVDARTLELVRDRVHSLLGLPSSYDDWRDAPTFSAAERAVLDYVEQFVFSVSTMDDSLVSALLEHLSPVEVHELSNIVWAVDLTTRLDLVAGAVLA